MARSHVSKCSLYREIIIIHATDQPPVEEAHHLPEDKPPVKAWAV